MAVRGDASAFHRRRRRARLLSRLGVWLTVK
jgi:hypothetical protein